MRAWKLALAVAVCALGLGLLPAAHAQFKPSPGPGGGGPPQPQSGLLAAPNVPRTDFPALARSQVRAIREEANRAATTAPAGVMRAHWQDIAARAEAILEPRRGR